MSLGDAAAAGLAALPFLVIAAAGIWFAVLGRGFGFALLFMLTAPATAIAVGPVTLPDVFLLPALATGLLNLRRVAPPLWVVLPGVAALIVGYAAAVTDLFPTILFAVSIVAVPVAIALHGTSTARIRSLMIAFAAGATVNAAVGVFDAATGFSMAEVTGFGGVRTAALTTHSNQLGLICVLAVPVVLYLARERRALGLMLPVILAGAVASGSRGALLGVPVAWGLLILADRRPVVSRTVVAVGGMVAAYLLAIRAGLDFGLERLLGNDATATISDRERETNAALAIDQASANLWLGVGFGENAAHNLYLELARSGGVIVLLAFLVWATRLLLAGRSVARNSGQATAALVSFAVWLLLAVQHNAVSVRFIYIPAGLVLACWLVARRGSGDALTTVGNPQPQRARGRDRRSRAVADVDAHRVVAEHGGRRQQV